MVDELQNMPVLRVCADQREFPVRMEMISQEMNNPILDRRKISDVDLDKPTPSRIWK